MSFKKLYLKLGSKNNLAQHDKRPFHSLKINPPYSPVQGADTVHLLEKGNLHLRFYSTTQWSAFPQNQWHKYLNPFYSSVLSIQLVKIRIIFDAILYIFKIILRFEGYFYAYILFNCFTLLPHNVLYKWLLAAQYLACCSIVHCFKCLLVRVYLQSNYLNI